jgi:uncharacterized protein (TIGR00645 family)
VVKIRKEDAGHKFQDKTERLLFASRWILSPMYIILIIVLALILIKFAGEVFNFIMNMWTFTENEWIIEVLKLLDLTLVANLVLIVALSGYENFVSKLDIAQKHVDRPSWMGRLDFSGLKLKIIGSVVAISIIELLQDFLKMSFDPNIEYWRIIIHLTFVVTGVAFAGMEILAEKRDNIQNKDKLIEL